MIKHELNGPHGSLLDIGCNEGYFTRFSSEEGWFSIGVDIDKKAIQFARQKSVLMPNVAFINQEINKSFIETLPVFDVILLLSTFQEIYVLLGKDHATKVLGGLLNRCRIKMIMEPASTNAKYGEPEFFSVDNNRAAIEAGMQRLISQFPGWKIREIGATPYSDTEPHRYMYAIERIEPLRVKCP